MRWVNSKCVKKATLAVVQLLRTADLPTTYKSLTAVVTLATRHSELRFEISFMDEGAIIIYM